MSNLEFASALGITTGIALLGFNYGIQLGKSIIIQRIRDALIDARGVVNYRFELGSEKNRAIDAVWKEVSRGTELDGLSLPFVGSTDLIGRTYSGSKAKSKPVRG